MIVGSVNELLKTLVVVVLVVVFNVLYFICDFNILKYT